MITDDGGGKPFPTVSRKRSGEANMSSVLMANDLVKNNNNGLFTMKKATKSCFTPTNIM